MRFFNNVKYQLGLFSRKYIKPFFFSSSCREESKRAIKPIYFWATLFLLATLVSIVTQIVMTIDRFLVNQEMKVDLVPLIAVLGGMTIGLVAMYNQGNKVKSEEDEPEKTPLKGLADAAVKKVAKRGRPKTKG